MNTYFALVVLPNLQTAVSLALLIVVLSIAGTITWRWTDTEENKRRIGKLLCNQMYWGCILGILLIFMPTEQQLIKVYAIDAIKQTEGIDKLPKNIVAKLNKLLEVDEDKE